MLHVCISDIHKNLESTIVIMFAVFMMACIYSIIQLYLMEDILICERDPHKVAPLCKNNNGFQSIQVLHIENFHEKFRNYSQKQIIHI